MKTLNVNAQQQQQMKTQLGFIAALDQSGGSTPSALRLYGIKEGAWSNEDEMFALVHQMRTRVVTCASPAYIARHGLPWCVTQVGARCEFQFGPRPTHPFFMS